MADLLDEVVMPAFTDDELERRYGDTTYFFHGVDVIDLGTRRRPEPIIVGTFVKDTIIRREQIYDRERKVIKRDPLKMKSAPSATFVILLVNHKLLYLHETSHAPPIDAFRATLEQFLRKKYFEFIEQEYEKRRNDAADDQKSGITKKKLKTEFLSPELSIIPLSSEQELTDAVERYGVIEKIKIQLLRVNAEISDNQFFEQMREMLNESGANTSSFIEQNKEGLNSDVVVQHLAGAAGGGNARVTVDGKTPDRERLTLTNEEMRLRVPMENVPPERREKAILLVDTFNNLVREETLVVDRIDPDLAEAIRDKFRQ